MLQEDHPHQLLHLGDLLCKCHQWVREYLHHRCSVVICPYNLMWDHEAHFLVPHPLLQHHPQVLMDKGLMVLHHLSTLQVPGAHLHHLQVPLLATLTTEHQHHPTSLGLEAHLHTTILESMDHHLTSQGDLVISMIMRVAVPTSREWSSPKPKTHHTVTERIRVPHMALPLEGLHQTTLMDEEVHLEGICQGIDFPLRTSSVAPRHIEGRLMNQEEG